MIVKESGAGRLRLKLRVMRDEDLWWLFLNHGADCKREFWEEVATRKAAGTLSKGSRFWAIEGDGRDFSKRRFGNRSNLVVLTREEWEARRRRKLFRLISA
jgi:hypothetical protein